MVDVDELKSQVRKEASGEPEKFFPIDVLENKGFSRDTCEECGRVFWSSEPRDICGEPECGSGYTFIEDSPTEETLTYQDAWDEFCAFMSERGYTSVNRYPVVARWRDDLDFTIASISNFQPQVVEGVSEPPADEMVIPQPSLRFNDVDNVGVTGRHYVLHDHIGQTCFKEENYDQDRYFRDMFEFTIRILGIPKSEIVVHEDAWAGGGNLGASMEFFVGGLELFNQVYMFYSVTEDGYEELDQKVLDMGMGHERITWITHGTQTSYRCVMPDAVQYMEEKTDVDIESDAWQSFLPHSSRLNRDEVEDIEQVWQEIADEIGVEREELKRDVRPVADLYAVAEHARALLFPLADGAVPGSAGGGHNLRVVYRRARDLMRRHSWDSVDIRELVEIHAKSLEPIFPGLEEKLPQVQEMLKAESQKYESGRKKAETKIEDLEDPDAETLVELYESHGVTPEMMKRHGIRPPDDLYTRLTSTGTDTEGSDEQGFELGKVPETEKLYYKDQERTEFSAGVVAVRGDHIALDRTCFYPTGGGQEHDTGMIQCGDQEFEVVDVEERDGVILHRVPEHDLNHGDGVTCEVDRGRRRQLMQHHTGAHLVGAAAREVLGDHVDQAGAHKSPEDARLDITHYESLDRGQLMEIEEVARRLLIEDHDVEVMRLSKREAEDRFGFRIYQGGAPPGDSIRLIQMGEDVQACGGTHVSSTSELDELAVTGSQKVQDGVIRLRFRAGETAEEYVDGIRDTANRAADLLGAEEADNHREAVHELTEMYSVEKNHVLDTLERFLEERDDLADQTRILAEYLGALPKAYPVKGDSLLEKAESLFEARKQQEKQVEELESRIESHVRDQMENRQVTEKVPTENIGLLIQVSRKLAEDFSAAVRLEARNGAVAASYREDVDARQELEELGYARSEVDGDGSFAKAIG
jgi:alanyl-tRNA synthetase